MGVKRYIGKDINAAMTQVREELGKDAIIVANRVVDAGVELIAAGDFDALQQYNPGASADNDGAVAPVTGVAKVDVGTEARLPKMTSAADGAMAATAAVATASQTRRPAVDSEKSSETAALPQSDLRTLLEGPDTNGGFEISNAAGLLSMGLGVSLVRQLLQQIRNIDQGQPALEKITQLLSHQLPTLSIDVVENGGVYVFHGGSGAGKTTVIGKLAAACVAQKSADDVVLVNADHQAVGNGAKLSAIGETLGIQVLSTDRSGDIVPQLLRSRRKHLVLVDTAALPVVGDISVQQLTAATSRQQRPKHVLVMAASSQQAVMDSMLAASHILTLDCVVLSKIDETAKLGIAIDSLIRSGQKLAYWSDNMNLHHPLRNVEARELVVDACARCACWNEQMVVPAVATKASADVGVLIDPYSVATQL